jgi:hypothetical protein
MSTISAITVDGVHTDVVITPYVNKMFVVITQTGTMGTLVRHLASSPAATNYQHV